MGSLTQSPPNAPGTKSCQMPFENNNSTRDLLPIPVDSLKSCTCLLGHNLPLKHHFYPLMIHVSKPICISLFSLYRSTSLAQNSHRPTFQTGITQTAPPKNWALWGGQREAASHSKYWERLRGGNLESGPRQVVHDIKVLIADHRWSWQSLFWSLRSNLLSAKSYKAFPEHQDSKTKMEIYSIVYKAQSPWAEKSSAHTASRSSFLKKTQLRARQQCGDKWELPLTLRIKNGGTSMPSVHP